ncbi:MAG: hypothetical protein EXS37_17985 [Opitutus sp.]|nr:hypothetical protein [Opitutus sp.]
MKHLFAIGLGWAAVAVAAYAAEETFSRAIRAQDFSAAGLDKLSPEEVARLDALVREFKSGAMERARRDAAVAEARAVKAEARVAAEVEKTKERDVSRPVKAKVVVSPGTKVEYAAVESRIAGEFRGWEGRTTFTLENGQRWQVAGSDPYVCPPIANPAVKITPGALGTFWMTIEGVRSRAKVVAVGGAR